VIFRFKNNKNNMIIFEYWNLVKLSIGSFLEFCPEGGDGGGTIVATGTPQQVAKIAASYIGQYLKKLL